MPTHVTPSPITLRPTAAFRYGVAALLRFAGRESDKLTVAELSEGMSPLFVRNILSLLRRAGDLTSSRGAVGGYRLARPLSKISVLDVLVAIDGPVVLDVDDLPTALTAGSVRTLRRVLDGVAGDVAARLSGLTLADL